MPRKQGSAGQLDQCCQFARAEVGCEYWVMISPCWIGRTELLYSSLSPLTRPSNQQTPSLLVAMTGVGGTPAAQIVQHQNSAPAALSGSFPKFSEAL